MFGVVVAVRRSSGGRQGRSQRGARSLLRESALQAARINVKKMKAMNLFVIAHTGEHCGRPHKGIR